MYEVDNCKISSNSYDDDDDYAIGDIDKIEKCFTSTHKYLKQYN